MRNSKVGTATALATFVGSIAFNQPERPRRTHLTASMVDCVAVVKKYFEVWNAHDVAGIQALHAPSSTLTDWDASHGPTNEAVAKGIGGIWEAVPNIKIEVLNVFTCASYPKCVANIKVIVGNEEGTILNVCDVFEFDEAGLVTSLFAYKAD